jgi:plasmid maintenance system antidote protein VapI
MSASTSIGQRFTQLIQHLGLSKNAFAQSLDKTATVIQHLVDERNKPGYDLLCKVFEVYPNVSKDWLMEGAGSMLKADASYSEAPTAVSSAPAAAPIKVDLFAVSAPPVEEPVPPVAPPTPAPVGAAATVPPVVAAAGPTPPAVAAPPTVAAPDPAYLTAALQTQYLQHQLALAEQRNQHLQEQQALMQQLVAVLQGR